MRRTCSAYSCQVKCTASPGVRSAIESASRAAVSWNASHRVAAVTSVFSGADWVAVISLLVTVTSATLTGGTRIKTIMHA